MDRDEIRGIFAARSVVFKHSPIRVTETWEEREAIFDEMIAREKRQVLEEAIRRIEYIRSLAGFETPALAIDTCESIIKKMIEETSQ